jgi:hypothetical protein
VAASLATKIPRGWRIAWLVPFALGVLPCFALQREPASLIAPLFGPWAGLLYGHRECTMASQIPIPTLATSIAGVALVAGYLWLRPGAARTALATALIAWALAWTILATLSVLNTTV